MATNQPLDPDGFNESKLPLMFRLKGTVILKIWWQILFVIVYTAAIVCVHNFVDGFRMNFPQTLVPILGVVTGLLLVFRTNTAYDRYWEGRRLWSQMTLGIRNLTRCIWAGVDERPGVATDVLEKVSAINLLVAFVYSVKNYLREEYSYDEEDMKDLISHLPQFATPSSNQSLEKQDPSNLSRKSLDLGSKQSNIRMTSKSTSSINNNSTKAKQYNLTAHDYVTPTNIPIELSYYITSYVNSVRIRNICDSSTISTMNSSLASLVDCLTGFERILRTPIPLAYSVHLHHSMWLYLLALPYQLVGSLNWFTIPAVALASFALLGILGIGWEIENPFGYDDNDLVTLIFNFPFCSFIVITTTIIFMKGFNSATTLESNQAHAFNQVILETKLVMLAVPLDDFCKVIRKEIQVIMGRALPTPESWIMSKENHPLAPISGLGAEELAKKSVQEIRNILAKGAAISQQSVSPRKFCEEEDVPLRMVVASNSRHRNVNNDWKENSSHNSGVDRPERVSMLKKDGNS